MSEYAQELYEVYAAENSRQGVEVMSWDELDSVDQAAWEAVAQHCHGT